ncbi:MAG: cell division protein ZapA, partial [Bacteroidales bacterium]|nr:cell division protein ZapA [Bacteroidales bacterium]
MDDFTITVSIADRSYRIKIQRDKEELIRYAAKSVNTSVQKYAENYAYSDKQDLLALTALEFASGLKGKESEFAEQE